MLNLVFRGEVWFWRGPAPWHFVTVPEEHCRDIAELSSLVSYGWGMIPATVSLGGSEWATALWPKDGAYIVPIKTWVRKAERIDIGDTVTVRVTI
jgi:hypothetical protein